MDLDTFIITVFCQVDDMLKSILKGGRLRERGPAPLLADSEVLAMEVVGEYLGLVQDKGIFGSFRCHYSHFFPGLRQVHRTTFVRQAANLWKVKEQVWQRLLEGRCYDATLAIVDSFPLPVCQFARAYRCQRFKGEAAFGKDILVRQTFYGFRVHVRLCWPGVVTRFVVTPANVHELATVPELAEGTTGLLVGDRNYWAPLLKEELHRTGLDLLAPFRRATRDPWPRTSALLSRIRYRIDTVFSQLVERYHIKRVWARDTWHLVSRLLRKALSHTFVLWLNQQQGRAPLHMAEMLT
jgi:hypothetical protein